MNENGRKLPRSCMLNQAMYVLVLCLQCAPLAHTADKNQESYRDLKLLQVFSSISVSIYNTDAKATESETGFSAEELTKYLQLHFTNFFPDIPYQNMDAPDQADPADSSSVGQLYCRVWVDGENTPAVFQVKCQISSSTRFNIINDASFGYGPKEKVPEIVREQMIRILRGLSSIFFRIRNDL